MDSYLESFSKLKTEINLNPEVECDIIRNKFDLENGDMTAFQVKDEIENHIKKRDDLEKNIPSELAVSAFLVNIEEIRNKLISKRDRIIEDLKTQILNYANAMRDAIRAKYDAIWEELEKPLDTIYIIDKMKKYMEDVPTLVIALMGEQDDLYKI